MTDLTVEDIDRLMSTWQDWRDADTTAHMHADPDGGSTIDELNEAAQEASWAWDQAAQAMMMNAEGILSLARKALDQKPLAAEIGKSFSGFPKCHAWVRYRSDGMAQPSKTGPYLAIKVQPEHGMSINFGISDGALELFRDSIDAALPLPPPPTEQTAHEGEDKFDEERAGRITGFYKPNKPCYDCIGGWCQMNCGPVVAHSERNEDG